MSSSYNNSNGNVQENGLGGGRISSWAPAAVDVGSSTAEAKHEDLTITVQLNKSSLCTHLEKCMFPKFLSLDCNQLDSFCMGRVTDATNPARTYIEALHLKDFLKDSDALTKDYNKKRRIKRASRSPSPSKKKSRGTDIKDVVDEKSLAQTFWGGFEGKRTWILNSDNGIAGAYCQMVPPQIRSRTENDLFLEEFCANNSIQDATTSDESLDILLNSELRLRTLQKAFKLHDRTTVFDNFVCNTSDDALPPQDDEFKLLEDLTMPLSITQPPSVQNTDSPGASATAEENYLENSPEANEIPLVPSSTSEVPITLSSLKVTSGKLAETEGKVNEASTQGVNTKEVVTTEQVVASLKPEEPTAAPFHQNEISARSKQLEAQDKADEIISQKMNSDENKAPVGQVRSETLTMSSSSAATPLEQLVSCTSTLKTSSEKEEKRAPMSPTGSKTNVTRRQVPPFFSGTLLEETAESLHTRAVREGKDASFVANKILSSFRQNRRKFWNTRNTSEIKCLWCSSIESAKKSTNNPPAREFGAIESPHISAKGGQRGNDLITCPSGDNLIQCLECDLIGCRSGLVGGESHSMLHFLMSGHRYGVTCGESGEIFCMGCGDIVQHECFDRERERVFLEQNYPSLCWQECLIIRGINPSSFTVTKEQGYVWRGLLASYPIPAPAQFVRASQSALRRLLMFRGCSTSKMAVLGPSALKLAMHRQAHINDRLVPTPVGLYNLGNTCYLNSTLQCLLNCVPLQEVFLSDLTHPYQCCSILKGGKSSCLACEMDKLFLEHFGSAIGIDAIAALEEEKEAPSTFPIESGHPVIPSNFLAEVWKNSTVRHLARHDQHDAQEFYHALIDGLETDVLSYQETLRDIQQAIKCQSQIKNSAPSPGTPSRSSIKDIFEGELRSVLICDECGCKRSQLETFLNLSLPLKNQFPSQSEVATRERVTTRSETNSIHSCLNHFTDPETLSDPIYCPSCNRKTKTLKQHTFAKLPRVLCLHLKRFDAASNKKISDFVSFPASDLDMGNYLPHWRVCEKILSAEKNDDGTTQIYAESPRVLYDLFATVNHRGTLHQGHYTSNVKCGNHWYHCNDAFVCDAGEGNGEKEVLLAEGAYMLFYRRKEKK